MTGRGAKRRGRPPKTPSMERPTKFQYHLMKKPKYLMNKGSDSQMSTPSASRASSPQDSECSRRSISRPSTSRVKPSRGSGRGRRRGGGNHHNKTPAYSKKAFESEYHYGSDFGDSSDDNDQDDDLLLSASESDSLEGENENNDSDFSISSFSNESGNQKRSNRVPSPDPLWLQQKDYPPLKLPDSSDDLLIPKQFTLKTASIYEVFRRFRNLIRLSPFRFEDFCAALVSDEQTALLTEIHMMLLKAQLREEDAQATHFGPLEQKDSINISIYLMDQITWPEVLRSYVESDNGFDKNILNILATKDYPYVGIEDKLAVLQFLTDQFLVTAVVRDDLLQEGPIHYDDHCRICHRLGDLLCCETCPAVFHLECVDPPLVDVPTEDWQCHLCKAHQVSGVQDCISTQEKQGLLCRQEHLGYDRHGRKYWFVARRIFIETEDASEVWYYSSVPQFELLLSLLDENEMELALYREIADYKDEITRQMAITETVTNKSKGNKKSYLEVENQNILDRIKKEKEAAAVLENGDAEKTDDKDGKKDEKKETTANGEEKPADNAQTKENEAEKPADATPTLAAPATPNVVKNVVTTRLKTGSLTPRNYSTDDLKRKNSISVSKDDLEKHGIDGDTRLTRNKLNQITSGTLLFKLGMENTSKSYVNQFTTNPIALNKPQRNEERDKKRHLSHKFSLTTASDFKWIGVLNGTHTNVISMLRQTILALEQSIVPPFMHPNWSTLRKVWVQAVSNASKPDDFAKVLVILQACVKSPVFANVWHEQLGHIRLQRITSSEREEKKKLEKREKRERDDEEERNRLAINFVKYSLGLKHQVWKQRGEEYRIHGQWGWIWMATGRRQIKAASTVYERQKPHRIVTKIKNNGIEKIVTLDPATHEYLVKNTVRNEGDTTAIPSELKHIEIVNVSESFSGVLNVSDALAARNRLVYPKIGRKSVLDDLLKRRTQLKVAEEEKILIPKSEEISEPPVHVIAKTNQNKVLSPTEKQLLKIAGIKAPANSDTAAGSSVIPNVNMELVNNLAKSIQSVRSQFGQLNRLGKQYKCYNKECNVNNQTFSLTQVNGISCYSPLCLQKSRVKKQLLVLLRKAHTAGNGSKDTVAAIMNIVNKKPSILEQKLTEGKRNDNDSLMDEDSCSAEDIDPSRLKNNLFNAFNKGVVGNDESDINSFIQVEDQKEEQTIKEESKEGTQRGVGNNDDVCVTGEQVVAEGGVKCETDAETVQIKDEVEKMETNATNEENSDKMDIDEELSNQKTIVETRRTRLDDSVSDVDVTSNQEEPAVVPEKDSLSNSDENSRERRSSRRSVKGRTSIKTTTTTTKTTTKYDDGSEESESNSMTKTRSKDTTYNNSKVSTVINSSSSAVQSRYVLKPNRRFAAATSRSIKKEDTLKIEKEIAPDGTERVYSTASSRGKVYLSNIVLDGANKIIKKECKSIASKYPEGCGFLTKKGTTSIMVLQRNELVKLARTGGKLATAGFHHLAKNNLAVWPYPCSRPLFKTCWLFRTVNVKTLAAIAAQLRIIWCCLRWDDMATKPPTSDGKHQVTTETEIMSLEILKHRIVGRFSEKTQYLRRKVVIPLELPKTIREVTSIRSGLRKRKRAESPQKTDPQVSEEWVDEDKLELWEIKLFGEKQEKANAQPVTRASTGKLPIHRVAEIQANVKGAASPATPVNNAVKKIVVSHKATPEEIKEKMELQLRIQRAAHHQKRALEMQKNQDSPKTPIIGQRKIIVKNPDGTTKIIHQGISDQATPKTPEPTTQKVQIIRGSDGKVSVRGLNPGQQLIQMPDGKLHVLTSSMAGNKPSHVAVKTNVQKTITKVLNQPQAVPHNTPTSAQKVLIRQQVPKTPASPNVVVKTPLQKMVPQRVVVSGGQILSTPQQKVQVTSGSAQKINTSKGQILLSTPTQKVVQTSNLQQLLTQTTPAGQKIVINQTSMGNKLILSGQGQQQTVTQQQGIVQSPAPTQQIMLNQPGQKVLQQFVNSSNQQQQIIVGGQRILLNPGQRIITQQQQQPQVVQQVVQQPQIVQQQIIQPQQQQIVIQQQQQQQHQTVQQVIVQQAPQQQQQQQQQPAQQQTQQIIVNNASLAQQLAQGKLQVANVNGQQVIIKPMGNNQVQIVAHIKTQVDGNSHIVANMNEQTVEQQSQPVQQAVQQQVVQPKVIIQQQSPKPTIQQQTVLNSPPQQQTIQTATQISPSIEQSLLQGQPPGTVIKCVTAQVIQTQNGLRIMLQGLQGNDFTPQQLVLVQQQVKQQLLKAQEASGKQGMIGPTKIYLAVHPASNQQAQPPPLTPVQIKPEINSSPQIQQKQPLIQTSPLKTECKAPVINDPVEVIMDVVPMVGKQEKQEEITEPSVEEASNKLEVPEDLADSFIVTPDYIQQTIKNALRQENLNPEIEEKLLNLQRYQEKQMKGEQQATPAALVLNHHEYTSPAKTTPRKRPTSKTHDDEWQMDTPKRRPPKSNSQSEKKVTPSSSAIETNVNRIIRSVEKEAAAEIKEVEEAKEATVETTPSPTKPNNNRRIAAIKRESEKKKQQQQLQLRLYRQKEQLKKDILKKRVVLEKELQIEIQKELATELASRAKQERNKQNEIKATGTATPNKRRSGGACNKPGIETKSPKAATSSGEGSRKSAGSVRRKPGKSSSGPSKKKQKLYCICQTPYDDSKFYVGCDLCNNWFHGECVKITEVESKKLSEFVCSECQHARDTQELYCLCRKPYDETQFYICCDKCQDWFHGRCVGILQSEADSIDEYICPNCQSNTSVNFANMKEMSTQEHENLKKLIKQIQIHKSAWPFMEPVDHNEAPDYYVLIKDPMDLQKIEAKINNKSYSTLSDFIADMTKIFDNCRFYNSKESPFYRCAESLEGFFVQKIKDFRENLVDSKLP